MKDYLDIGRTKVDFGDACFSIHHIHWHYTDPSDEAEISYSYRYFQSHPYYELHLMASGQGLIDFREHSVVLCAGEAVIIAPGEEHVPIQISGDGAENLTLAFSVQETAGDSGAYAYFSGTLGALTAEPVVFAPPPDFTSDLRMISKMSQNGSLRDYCYVKTVCFRMIFLLFDRINQFHAGRRFREEGPQRSVKKAKTTDSDSLSIILENLLNEPNIPLAQIARRLGYSERQTQRLIRSRYKKSFRAVRQDMLFASACRMFQESPLLPPKEVAARAGFVSLSSMEKLFVRKCGQSPEEYRKALKEG